MGSTRAELHSWEVNIQTRTAQCLPGGHRQIYPMDKPLFVKPLAAEITKIIVAGKRRTSG